ncbi:hypothetical protein MP638_006329 [Amoeboaphelidium occidentale]|nr:hypothetical protein MP638_006329 [Amoeboaphelidium occidentale]
MSSNDHQSNTGGTSASSSVAIGPNATQRNFPASITVVYHPQNDLGNITEENFEQVSENKISVSLLKDAFKLRIVKKCGIDGSNPVVIPFDASTGDSRNPFQLAEDGKFHITGDPKDEAGKFYRFRPNSSVAKPSPDSFITSVSRWLWGASSSTPFSDSMDGPEVSNGGGSSSRTYSYSSVGSSSGKSGKRVESGSTPSYTLGPHQPSGNIYRRRVLNESS